MGTTTEGRTDNNFSYTQDRELSWLRFNERVLEEAEDLAVPLYERMKFAAIFQSNLDEFFMIRVGSLTDLSLLKETHIDNKTGMTPSEQLREIMKAVPALYKRRDRAVAELERELETFGVRRLHPSVLEKKDRKFLDEYFESYLSPVISPQIVDARHPFPHLANLSLTVAVLLHEAGGHKGDQPEYGLIPMSPAIPRVVWLPGDGVRYLLAEDVLLEYADQIFSHYEIAERAIVRVSRNADINPDDESFDVEEDYRRHMKKILKKRARLAPVRLELEDAPSEKLIKYLCERLELRREQVFCGKTPLDLSYVYELDAKLTGTRRSELTYPPFAPYPARDVDPNENLVRQALRRDILCSYPFESMEPFLRLIREAAYDPNVISIKITVYRLARKAKLIDYLIAAAENGKDVTVLMELRARFDEQNNINWSEELEEAGCQIQYGFEGYKVHSKLCLITRREKGKIQYITQVGTGNYNEKTAKLYTDLSLITSDPGIGTDAAEFFKNMAISDLDGAYVDLLVAPHGLKPRLLELIGEQARKGEEGRIILKMNSLTDRDLIDALAEASQAGVDIDLIIRGICCLRPGIEGKTERIRVRSIVGRFLEHSRIYCFGRNAADGLYISSADFMTRNTERRVEVACPVKAAAARERILSLLDVLLSDNVKARRMDPLGQYERMPAGGTRVDSQEAFLRLAALSAPAPANLNRRPGGETHRPLGNLRDWLKSKL